jgi:hypothetical protein
MIAPKVFLNLNPGEWGRAEERKKQRELRTGGRQRLLLPFETDALEWFVHIRGVEPFTESLYRRMWIVFDLDRDGPRRCGVVGPFVAS